MLYCTQDYIQARVASSTPAPDKQ